jgi:hypothetical protein
MQKTLHSIAALTVASMLIGCQTTAEHGLFGTNGYLQLLVDNVVVYEYNVPAGGMKCQLNAAFNNKELDPVGRIRYRCVWTPASASELPYNFVAISTLGPHQGFATSQAATIRFASSAACWEAIADLKTESKKLVSESCGPKEPPAPLGPGERRA